MNPDASTIAYDGPSGQFYNPTTGEVYDPAEGMQLMQTAAAAASTNTGSPEVDRAQVVSALRQQMGLNNDPSSWSYDEAQQYRLTLAAYIQQNPGQFTAQDQTVASGVISAGMNPLDDTSVWSDLDTFESAFADSALAAGQKIAGIGQGVLNTASLAQYAIPIALVIIAAIWLRGFNQRQAA